MPYFGHEFVADFAATLCDKPVTIGYVSQFGKSLTRFHACTKLCQLFLNIATATLSSPLYQESIYQEPIYQESLLSILLSNNVLSLFHFLQIPQSPV